MSSVKTLCSVKFIAHDKLPIKACRGEVRYSLQEGECYNF